MEDTGTRVEEGEGEICAEGGGSQLKWRCSVCGEEKPVEEMIRDATRVRGRKKRCKPCHAELNKALRQKKGANELRGRPKRGKWMFHPRLFKNIKS